MEKKHVVLTKDGMRVGVKEVGREGYVDRTQRYVISPTTLVWFGGWGMCEGWAFFGRRVDAMLMAEYSILVQAWNFSRWTGGWWGQQQQQQQEEEKGNGGRRRGR